MLSKNYEMPLLKWGIGHVFVTFHKWQNVFGSSAAHYKIMYVSQDFKKIVEEWLFLCGGQFYIFGYIHVIFKAFRGFWFKILDPYKEKHSFS